MKKRAKSTQPNPSPRSSTQQSVKNASRTSSPWGRSPSGKLARLPCKDYLKWICTTPFCEKWHPPEYLFYKSENGCRFVKSVLMRIARLMNNLAKGFKIMVTKVQWLCSKLHDNWVAYLKMSNIRKPIRCVRFTEAVLRQANIRDWNPSLGMICAGDPHHHDPNGPKVEDRSQEETEWQEWCARYAAWKLAKNILKLKDKNKAAFFSPSEKCKDNTSITRNYKGFTYRWKSEYVGTLTTTELMTQCSTTSKGNWQERGPVTDQCHDRPGKPGKRSDKKLGQKSSKRQSSNARQLICVFQDMTPPKSILRKSTDMQKPIQRVKLTKAIARHFKIRDQHPSLGYICPGEPHQRSPNAPKFEDRSQEETEWQEQGAREAAWKLAKRVLKLKEDERATFFSLSEIGACLHQLLNLRNENLLSTPERQCTWSAKRTWVCWNGYFDEIVQSYDSHNRQWRSANAWRGNCVCQRIGYILDYESPR